MALIQGRFTAYHLEFEACPVLGRTFFVADSRRAGSFGRKNGVVGSCSCLVYSNPYLVHLELFPVFDFYTRKISMVD